MDFLEDLFKRHSKTHTRHAGGSIEHIADPYRPGHSAQERREAFWRRSDPHQRVGTRIPELVTSLLRNKVLLAGIAMVLFALVGGAVLALVVLLPLAGQLLGLVGAVDPTKLLADLPALLARLLVDAPKAILEYLGPLLKLKASLEGAG